ncbi:MAG TPA: hypothetical protein VHP37_05440 [Burkholderiales bacterium]|nr:hypothetical protein [Burkholderiales bacterium]
MCSCATSPAAHSDPLRGPTPAFNDVAAPASDCWARLYEHSGFGGRALTLAGPTRVGGLAPHPGFPWEPRYDSLVVGPGAVLALFAGPDFKEREATFEAGAKVRDLDDEMSVFRRIRSMTVTCAAPKTAAKR